MPYNNNTPLSNQTFTSTQAPIQQNFAIIQSSFDVNHVDFNAASNVGKHNFVEFPTAVPTGTTAPGPEVALYSNTGTVSAVPELFFQRNNLGANAGYSITEYKNVANGNSGSSGWTRLPSGLLITWGCPNPPSSGANTLTFATQVPTFPGFTAVPFCVQVTPINGNSAVDANLIINIAQIFATNFTYYSGQRVPANTPAHGVPFMYLAIGI